MSRRAESRRMSAAVVAFIAWTLAAPFVAVAFPFIAAYYAWIDDADGGGE